MQNTALSCHLFSSFWRCLGVADGYFVPRAPLLDDSDMIADDVFLAVRAVVPLDVFALVPARNFPLARVNLGDKRGVVHDEIANQLIPVRPAAASDVLNRSLGVACVVRRIHTDGWMVVCHGLALERGDCRGLKHLIFLAVYLEESAAVVCDAELLRCVFLHPRAADRDAVTHEESLWRLCHVGGESRPVECFQWTFPLSKLA